MFLSNISLTSGRESSLFFFPKVVPILVFQIAVLNVPSAVFLSVPSAVFLSVPSAVFQIVPSAVFQSVPSAVF